MATSLYLSCKQLGQRLKSQNASLITVESCTGGGVASAITEVAGSSEWFAHGLVTYSNQAKFTLAGVAPELIDEFGAVSCEVAEAMAEGALVATTLCSEIAYSLAITGVAGPGGGTPEKPVGLVCFSWATIQRGQVRLLKSSSQNLGGDRSAVRAQSVRYSLETMLSLV
ncbi:MAG: CinA family protein [Acidiferrobacterales bacterium]|nr:CinA family protein [Acidiferrobacterales bacterium]